MLTSSAVYPQNAWHRLNLMFGNVNNNEQPTALASAILGPKGTSFWLGTYTPIPALPPQARMQTSVDVTPSGDVFINYLIWDRNDNRFKRQDVHYSTSNGILKTPNFQERGGFVQNVRDGEMLAGGVIVDQKNGRLILNGGWTIDGLTGNTLDQKGTVVKLFREEEMFPTVHVPTMAAGQNLTVTA